MEECAVVNNTKYWRDVEDKVKEQCVSRLLRRKEGQIDTQVTGQNIKADKGADSEA